MVSSCMYCFDLCISNSRSLALYAPSWSSDSHRFCFSQYPSLTHTVGQCPLSDYLPAARRRSGSFLLSFCLREKTACLGVSWRKGDFKTFFLAWPINQTSPRFVSFAPPILNNAEFPWSSICLHVSYISLDRD